MGSIRNNGSTLVIHYIKEGKQKSLVLMPGFNLNVPDDDIDSLHKHPIFKELYETERVEILTRDPARTSELEGFTVVESKRTGEPLPVFDTPRIATVPEAPKPEEKLPVLSSAQLLEFDGIGNAYAEKIISRQPEGGYASFTDMRAQNSDLTKLKDENWDAIHKYLEEKK